MYNKFNYNKLKRQYISDDYYKVIVSDEGKRMS